MTAAYATDRIDFDQLWRVTRSVRSAAKKPNRGRIAKLAELAALVPVGNVIVELGVNRGLALLAMAQTARVPLYGIDLWDMRLPDPKRDAHREARGFTATDNFDAFRSAVAEMHAENVTWVKGDTKEIAKVWSKPIGLLHIDAAHDYESVRKDFKAWSPSIVQGGWLCMDDAEPGRKVARVIEELVLPSGLWFPEPDLVDGRLFVARRK